MPPDPFYAPRQTPQLANQASLSSPAIQFVSAGSEQRQEVGLWHQYTSGIARLFRDADSPPLAIAQNLGEPARYQLASPKPLSNAGLNRHGDPLIINYVGRLIEHHTTSRFSPPEIIELGAGCSYPAVSSDWGGPWLSRRFATEFGSRIKIQATDRNQADLALISRSGTGAIRAAYADSPQKISGVGSDRFGYFFLPNINDSTSNHEVNFARPWLDPFFEREIFNLDVITADLTDIGATCSGRKFDFIFARHQPPRPQRDAENLRPALVYDLNDPWRTVAESLTTFLTKTGRAWILVDDLPTRRTLLYQTLPDGLVSRFQLTDEPVPGLLSS